jgi:hypothetical protein
MGILAAYDLTGSLRAAAELSGLFLVTFIKIPCPRARPRGLDEHGHQVTCRVWGCPGFCWLGVLGLGERGPVDCFIFDGREFSQPPLPSPAVVGPFYPGRNGQP